MCFCLSHFLGGRQVYYRGFAIFGCFTISIVKRWISFELLARNWPFEKIKPLGILRSYVLNERHFFES